MKILYKGVVLVALLGILGSLFGCGQVMDGDGMVRTPEMIAEDLVSRMSDGPMHTTVTMEEGKAMMEYMDEQKISYIIVDVRRADEFTEGHLQGAVNVPNESVTEEGPNPMLPGLDQIYMVYCRSGRRSKEAADKLQKAGYTRVIDMGGILDWKGIIIKE